MIKQTCFELNVFYISCLGVEAKKKDEMNISECDWNNKDWFSSDHPLSIHKCFFKFVSYFIVPVYWHKHSMIDDC